MNSEKPHFQKEESKGGNGHQHDWFRILGKQTNENSDFRVWTGAIMVSPLKGAQKSLSSASTSVHPPVCWTTTINFFPSLEGSAGRRFILQMQVHLILP